MGALVMSDYKRYERDLNMETKCHIPKGYWVSYIKMDKETGSEHTSKPILNVGARGKYGRKRA